MIDTAKVTEWKDVYYQLAQLHEKDSTMYRLALENFKRVFQRKLERFGIELQTEMERGSNSPVTRAPSSLV